MFRWFEMKAKIVYNKTKKWAAKSAKEVQSFLRTKKVKTVNKGADFTIVIGGDGTMLYHKKKLEGAVLGIGSKKSYVCQCRKENWKGKLSRFLKKPRYEERITLSVSVGGRKKDSAVNDVALLSPDHGMLPVKVTVDGNSCKMEGDGILVATPTGSTAYCYSCGGAMMEGALDALQIVSVASHRRMFDPLVVLGSRRITLVSGTPAHLVVDGQRTMKLKAGAKVLLQANRERMKFAVV